VVVPALNEEAAIGALVRSLRQAAGLLGLGCEVIVVDGGSSDQTRKRAEEAGARVLPQSSRGFGGALREGFAAARGEYILTMDGDGSHSPEFFPRMWSKRREADLVIGSRYVPGGSAGMPLVRGLMSRILNLIFKLVLRLPLEDSSSGYRLYRASALQGLPLRASGFEFQQEALLEILARGGRTAEVPIRYLWREAGKSKARVLAFGPGYARTIARHWGLKPSPGKAENP